jgi:hypothetical protein
MGRVRACTDEEFEAMALDFSGSVNPATLAAVFKALAKYPPYRRGIPTKWLVARGLNPNLLPDNFPDLPELERRELINNAAFEARALQRRARRVIKERKLIAKWALPADLFKRSKEEQRRLRNAARQRSLRSRKQTEQFEFTPDIERAIADLDLPQAHRKSPVSQAEWDRRIKSFDTYMQVPGRAQAKLRPFRKRILAGWLVLCVLRDDFYRDPSGREFAEALSQKLGEQISRNSALKLLRRLARLEQPGQPWHCDCLESVK